MDGLTLIMEITWVRFSGRFACCVVGEEIDRDRKV